MGAARRDTPGCWGDGGDCVRTCIDSDGRVDRRRQNRLRRAVGAAVRADASRSPHSTGAAASVGCERARCRAPPRARWRDADVRAGCVCAVGHVSVFVYTPFVDTGASGERLQSLVRDQRVGCVEGSARTAGAQKSEAGLVRKSARRCTLEARNWAAVCSVGSMFGVGVQSKRAQIQKRIRKDTIAQRRALNVHMRAEFRTATLL